MGVDRYGVIAFELRQGSVAMKWDMYDHVFADIGWSSDGDSIGRS